MDEQPPAEYAPSRRRVVIGAAAAVIVLLGAGIAFAATRDRGTKASADGSSAHSSTTAPASAIGPGRTGSTSADGAPTSIDPARPGGTSPTTTKGAAGGSKATTSTPTTWRFSLAAPPTAPPGTTPPDITRAYTDGYTARCHDIWSHAGPDGQLWDAVNPDYGPFTVKDCLDGLDPTFAYLANSVAEARQMGVDDANGATADLTDSNRLRNAAGYVYDLPNA